MDYGKAIKLARSIAGLQQKDLAKLAGLDASHISLIEKGKRNPSLATLEKITQSLEMPNHLFTLLAAEPKDLQGIDSKEMQRISESLAQFLMRNVSISKSPRRRRNSRKAA